MATVGHKPVERETSLAKALRLLTHVAECGDPAGVSVASLVKSTGLSRPTAYRFLNELETYGLVRAKSSRWQLGPKVVALAAMNGSWAALRRRARDVLESFVREHGYNVHLGIRDDLEVVYIDKAESPVHPAVASVIGQRRQLHVTAMGKCLVAFDLDDKLAATVADSGLAPRTSRSISDRARWLAVIDDVRAKGVAFDDGECDVGSRCVAAPILDSQGYAMAAVSISALTRPGKVDAHRMETAVRRLADEIGDVPRKPRSAA